MTSHIVPKISVICAGCRKFNDYHLLAIKLDQFCIAHKDANVEIVSGTCRGADKLGEQYAKEQNLKCKQFPAEWKKFGRGAGPIRNREMAKYASHLIAFWDGNKNRSGTWSMIQIATKLGLTVEIVQFAQSDQGNLF